MKEVTGHDEIRMELLPVNRQGGAIPFPEHRKRVLLGRGNSCDIKVRSPEVSAIHAVIEKKGHGVYKVYDLNSTCGTYLNGQKVVAAELREGDKIMFGRQMFELTRFHQEDLPPPPLDMLSGLPPVMDEMPAPLPDAIPPSAPKTPQTVAKPPVRPPEKPKISDKKVSLPESPAIEELPVEVPTVSYPLAKDPKAEFSEYIFEDSEQLLPIFKYQVEKAAVEVTILYLDSIQSVDYIPTKDGVYSLVGARPSSKEVEFPYLAKKEKLPLVEVSKGQTFIHPPTGYDFLSLGDEEREKPNAPFRLGKDEIVRFESKSVQIYIRPTEAPPNVAHAPIMRKDREFKRYILLMFFLAASFLGPISFFEVDKELEKEKTPERIATILYKPKKMSVHKVQPVPKKDKKKATKSPTPPKKIVKPQDLPKKPPQQKPEKKLAKDKPKATKVVKAKAPGPKKPTPPKVRKATPNKGADRTKPRVGKKAGTPKKSTKVTARPKKAAKPGPSKGRVYSFNSKNFKSTISRMMAKGGALKGSAAAKGSTSTIGESAIGLTEEGATAQKAKVSNNIGSLSDITKGTIESGKGGAKGIVGKKSIFTAGLPYKTVILGGLDPNTIRDILIANLPQFRGCYQKELSRASRAFSGIVKLNFVIGASGNVTRASVDTYTRIPGSVRACVVNVLRGIQFPEPMGGGVVEVKQPLNFYPKVQ